MTTQKMEDMKGPLHHLFFGRLTREISYEVEGAEFISSQNDEEFLSIFLNPTESNELYTAWDKEFRTTCDMDVDGVSKTADVTTWLTSLPETLLFSITRAQMGDDFGNAASKNTDKFIFEDTIYVDRYMHENKEESTKVMKEVRILRE
jgi:hypothetical protein